MSTVPSSDRKSSQFCIDDTYNFLQLIKDCKEDAYLHASNESYTYHEFTFHDKSKLIIEVTEAGVNLTSH